MSFFEEARAGVNQNMQIRRNLPSWRYPPTESYLPTVLPWTRILGKSTNGRIALEMMRCWPTGLSLDIALFVTIDSSVELDTVRLRSHTDRTDTTSGNVHVGILFADGRHAYHVNSYIEPQITGNADGEQPIILLQGSSGTQLHIRQSLYLSPLPPVGTFKLITEWTDLNIPETFTEFDASEIHRQTVRAIPIW